MKRARRETDKQARQEQILSAAGALLDTQPMHAITMKALARQAGLAKGTLYLYFRTREEVFVALTHAELSAWLDSLHDATGGSVAAVASQLADELVARPRLVALLPVLHSVLACNLSDEAEARFAETHRRLLEQGGAHLARLLPALSAEQGQRVFVRLYTMLVGLTQVRPDRLAPSSQRADGPLRAAVQDAAQALLDT